MSDKPYPHPDGFLGREFMDNPKFQWRLVLRDDDIRYSTITRRPSFVYKGYAEPPKQIVRAERFWILDFKEETGDDTPNLAFYRDGGKALDWLMYVPSNTGDRWWPPKEGDAEKRANLRKRRRRMSRVYKGPIGDEEDLYPVPDWVLAQTYGMLANDYQKLLEAKTRDIGVDRIVNQSRREGMARVHGRMKQLLEVIIIPEPAYKILSSALHKIKMLIIEETE